MVIVGKTSLTEAEPHASGLTRMVSEPVEYQGVRDALRVSFGCSKALPMDLQRLLNRLR
jgi:hypothetical protein